MAGRRCTIVLKCLGCVNWVRQDLVWPQRARKPICPQCQQTAMRWLWAEGKRVEQEQYCEVCGQGQVIGHVLVMGIHGSRWLNVCGKCIRFWQK